MLSTELCMVRCGMYVVSRSQRALYHKLRLLPDLIILSSKHTNLGYDRSLCNMNIHPKKTDDVLASPMCLVQTVCKGLVHIRLQPRSLFHLNRDSNAQYRALHGQVWNVCCFKVPTCTVSQAALAARSHHPVKQAYETWYMTVRSVTRTSTRRRLTTCSYLLCVSCRRCARSRSHSTATQRSVALEPR